MAATNRTAAAATQPATTDVGKAINFNLSNFVKGGGFVLPAGDYRGLEHRIVLWDYEGKANQLIPFLRIAFVGLSSGKPVSDDVLYQYYTLGDASKYGPSDDGKQLVSLTGSVQLSESSNIWLYLSNLVNAGFPEDKLQNDFSVLDNMDVALHIINQPERNIPNSRSNLIQTVNAQPSDFPKTLAVPRIIHRLPWQKIGTVAPAKAAAKPAAAAAAAAPARPVNGATVDTQSGDISEILQSFLATVLGDEAVNRSKCRVEVFKAMNAAGLVAGVRDSALKAFQDNNVLEPILMGIRDGYVISGDEIIKVG